MITRKMTMKRLAGLPVTIHKGTKIESFTDGRATVHGPSGTSELGPFDTVVMAVGTRPNHDLLPALTASGIEVHVVGDALEPKQIMGAVQSAWKVAREI